MKIPIPRLAALGGLWLAGLLLAPVARADQNTKTLDVYWIDSEGGGSTLIVTPAGESVLIDAGNPGGRDSARIIKAAKAAGLTRIDIMMLTHFHIDHFGGAAEVAQQMPFGAIYQRAIPDHDPDGKSGSTFPYQIKAFRDISAKRVSLAPGVVIPVHGASGGAALLLRCIAADQKFIAPTAAQQAQKNPLTGTGVPKEIEATDNDNSAVFVLQFGDFRFYDGGDLTWNFEEKLVTPYNLPGIVDVYQTDHHGLEVSNNPVLIRSLAPTVVVMNNGGHKGGQPGAFAALKGVPSIQARFQIHKSVNVPAEENVSDDHIANLEDAKPADKCPASLIKMVVSPDGKNYTISIPANGTSQTFATKVK